MLWLPPPVDTADSSLFPPRLVGRVAASIQTKNRYICLPADSSLPPPTSWQAQLQVVFRLRKKGNGDKGKFRIAKPYHLWSITGGDIPTKSNPTENTVTQFTPLSFFSILSPMALSRRYCILVTTIAQLLSPFTMLNVIKKRSNLNMKTVPLISLAQLAKGKKSRP